MKEEDSNNTKNEPLSNKEADAPVEGWIAKFAEMMQSAPPTAMEEMKKYFASSGQEKNYPTLRAQVRVFSQEESDTMDAGIHPPQQEEANVESDRMVDNKGNKKQPVTKLPPKQNTLVAALEKVFEEQDSDETLIADMKLQGAKKPTDVVKFWEAVVVVAVKLIPLCAMQEGSPYV